MRIRCVTLPVLCFLVIVFPLQSGSEEQTFQPNSNLDVWVPFAGESIRIDGKLDDAVWKKAQVLRLGRTLDGGGSAAQPTEVKLLRDERILYVGVWAFEPLIEKLQASRRGHDGPIWSDDSIEIFLGVAGTYYQFGVNALGSTYDARAKDGSWNSGFRAAAGRGRSYGIKLTSVEERYAWRARDEAFIRAALDGRVDLAPFLEQTSGEAANEIIAAEKDPLSGQPVWWHTPVRIRKA